MDVKIKQNAKGKPVVDKVSYEWDGETVVVLNPLKAIRAKCLDCCGQYINEVKYCVIPDCPLWPFRMGNRATDANCELRPHMDLALAETDAYGCGLGREK